MESISLSVLNERIRLSLKQSFPEDYWVMAEIASIQENRSGHCYLELVDKQEGDTIPSATARAVVWAFTYRLLKPYFQTTTGFPLTKGMKILIQVEVTFHAVYGLSLQIKDIDPTYTVGTLVQARKEIIDRLTLEGVINMNKELPFPILPKNIAIISSPTAAGYGDFIRQLSENSAGYSFHIKLFPAIMQGERTSVSIIAALDKICENIEYFDVVVIIRGGGAQSDLSSFDSYDLGANIAQFPLPIISGIGHERDETIVDLVANVRVKTPTAAATYLIESFVRADAELKTLNTRFIQNVRSLLAQHQEQMQYLSGSCVRMVHGIIIREKSRTEYLTIDLSRFSKVCLKEQRKVLFHITEQLKSYTRLFTDRQVGSLTRIQEQMTNTCRRFIEMEKHRQEIAEKMVRLVHPNNILKLGYSITRVGGKVVTDVDSLQEGTQMETTLAAGIVKSRVEK